MAKAKVDRTLQDLSERVEVLESALREILRTKVNCKSGFHMHNLAVAALDHIPFQEKTAPVPKSQKDVNDLFEETMNAEE